MTLVADPVDVALRDGSTVRVRHVEPRDEAALRTLLDELSPESRWLRFFTAGADMRSAASRAASLDGSRGVGLVAVTGDDGRIVGHAEFVSEQAGRAEVAHALRTNTEDDSGETRMATDGAGPRVAA